MFRNQQGDLTDPARVALLPATALSPLLSLSPLSAAMHNLCVLDTFPAPAVVIIYQKLRGKKWSSSRPGTTFLYCHATQQNDDHADNVCNGDDNDDDDH